MHFESLSRLAHDSEIRQVKYENKTKTDDLIKCKNGHKIREIRLT